MADNYGTGRGDGTTTSPGAANNPAPPDLAAALEVAAPDSKKALKQLLISTLLMSAIAVGQVVMEVLPKLAGMSAGFMPAALAWLPSLATTVAAVGSAWLVKRAAANHQTSVTDALMTDSVEVLKGSTKRHFSQAQHDKV